MFMEIEVTADTFWELTTESGESCFIPFDLLNPADIDKKLRKDAELYCEFLEPITSIKPVKGIFGRLTAPGYMDSTMWEKYDSYKEAKADLKEQLAENDEDGEQADED